MRATLLETTVAAVGRPIITDAASRLVQMTVEGVGAVSATAYVEVTNDRIKWFKACLDMTVSGTASIEEAVSDNWPEFSASWAYMRATVTDVQGVNAKVTLTLSLT
jgi:hypothetical protein